MNKSSLHCFSRIIDYSNFTSRQLTCLALTNVALMSVNIITNALVIYVLIKTGQISNVTCKLFLVLSVTDLLISGVAQPLYTIELYNSSCSIVTASVFASVFLTHLSGYTIAIIGIDRYIRIKYYSKFKAIWTTRVVLVLFFIQCVLAFFQAFAMSIDLSLKKEQVIAPVYISMDSVVLATMILLQLQTIRTSNALYNESTVNTLERTDKKITKLSMRIMLMLCFFLLPYTTLFSVLRSTIKDQLNGNESSVLDFVTSFSVLFVYANSFANGVLFLMTNVKARRFFRQLIRE